MSPSQSGHEERGFIFPIGGAEEKFRDPVILKRFVDICGEDSTIAIIPTASQLEDTGDRYVAIFQDLGVSNPISLPFNTRQDCQDEGMLKRLAEADGIFLTGGNQLRLSTTLGGTPVAQTIRRRNSEGTHVAGTSAGAGFMSEHMIAFGDEGYTPRANMVTLSPGLGLTNKVIVDQHFHQRERRGRLLTTISYNPFAVGVGLGEDTAAIIGPDDTLEVVGSGGVTIIDPSDIEFTSMDSAHRDDPVCIVGAKLHILVDGWKYDLISKKAIQPQVALAR
jgi:cyanophycinase